jgi:GGDEF domain-containing protein
VYFFDRTKFESSLLNFIFALMTLDEFTHLDDRRQAQTLLAQGIYLTRRLYKNFSIILYQLDSFYVEIYHNLRFDIMQGMRCFEDDDALQPYLESIDISCLKL